MPRNARSSIGGFVYHVLNRANGRARIFETDGDYQAFEKVLWQARERVPVRMLSYCLMPNHWHLVLWPREDGHLSSFMQWLTVTHTQRWHAYHQTSGMGHLYQGRFKSFPVQTDEHFLTVCRYVERNPMRARLVRRAENWRWSSLWQRHQSDAQPQVISLDPWPLDPPRNWLDAVNRPDNEEELQALRQSMVRGSPFGSDAWRKRTAARLGLESTLRPRGRPKRDRNET